MLEDQKYFLKERCTKKEVPDIVHLLLPKISPEQFHKLQTNQPWLQ